MLQPSVRAPSNAKDILSIGSLSSTAVPDAHTHSRPPFAPQTASERAHFTAAASSSTATSTATDALDY
ncbi:hypothetical protein C8J57DRAFT_1533070 [Mycena rebaudengoi]|nr:hypothetical protein C8J57DRAFT_1533070 [Mycena rebaudengoi]